MSLAPLSLSNLEFYMFAHRGNRREGFCLVTAEAIYRMDGEN